jgi:hypothetical protein
MKRQASTLGQTRNLAVVEQMSPIVISVMVAVGILLLLGIGYINHMVENNALEKARLRADLTDRTRRIGDLSEVFPGQYMTPSLKLLLTGLELQLSERLLPVDKNNVELRARIAYLQPLFAQGEGIVPDNKPQPINNDGQAKEVRFQLETLHGQITRAAQEGILSANEAKQWIATVRHILVLLHIEFFTNLGQQAMQQKLPRQARLAYERGVQFLRKQPNAAQYKTQREKFEQQLAKTEAMILTLDKPNPDESTELNAGLTQLEEDDPWQKKNIYD